jgi:anti-sigma B factor antagonist
VKVAATTIVPFEGRISVNNSDEMRRKLLAALRARPAQITADLSHVTYMDSSGLATLLEAVRVARNQGTRLVLGGISGQPRQLFEVANLHALFEFLPQETDA